MNTQRRRLRKSEWVMLIVPLLLLAAWWANGPGYAVVHRYVPRTLGGHLPTVSYLNFSSDGANLAVESDRFSSGVPANELRVWDVENGRCLWVESFKDWAGWPYFSPDGKQVAILASARKSVPDPDGGMAESVVLIYDAATGQELHAWPVSDFGSRFRFLHQGQQLLVEGRNVRIWDMATGAMRTLARETSPSFFTGVAVDKAEKVYAVAARQKTGLPLGSYSKPGAFRVYDIGSGKLLRELQSPRLSGEVMQMSFSSDGGELTIVGHESAQDRTIKWPWRQNRPATSSLSFNAVERRLSPDGSLRVSVEWLRKGTGNNERYIGSKLHAENAQTLAPFWTRTLSSVARHLIFFPDSRHFAVFEDETGGNIRKRFVRVRRTSDGVVMREFESDYAFIPSPDGKTLATSSGNTVKLWDVSDLTQKLR